MARYIDADKLIESLELSIKSWSCDSNSNAPTIARTYQDVVYRVKQYITADVQEVRHGKWIGYPSITISKSRRAIQSIIYKCSCCGKSNGRAKSPYCKNCGAKMYGAEAEAKIKKLEEKK